ncbi:MAG: hypothetical protein AAF205_13865, partial [Pseudomonadota bacterium]
TSVVAGRELLARQVALLDSFDIRRLLIVVGTVPAPLAALGAAWREAGRQVEMVRDATALAALLPDTGRTIVMRDGALFRSDAIKRFAAQAGTVAPEAGLIMTIPAVHDAGMASDAIAPGENAAGLSLYSNEALKRELPLCADWDVELALPRAIQGTETIESVRIPANDTIQLSDMDNAVAAQWLMSDARLSSSRIGFLLRPAVQARVDSAALRLGATALAVTAILPFALNEPLLGAILGLAASGLAAFGTRLTALTDAPSRQEARPWRRAIARLTPWRIEPFWYGAAAVAHGPSPIAVIMTAMLVALIGLERRQYRIATGLNAPPGPSVDSGLPLRLLALLIAATVTMPVWAILSGPVFVALALLFWRQRGCLRVGDIKQV